MCGCGARKAWYSSTRRVRRHYTMYRLPDLFLQLGAEEFEFPVSSRPTNLRFTGPILPRTKGSIKVPEWLEKLDGSRPVVFVTPGTLPNYDFNQVVNPTLAGLAGQGVQGFRTAGAGPPNPLVAPSHPTAPSYL